MYIGIEHTTDSSHPQYKFKKFTSKKKAAEWRKNSGDFAWSGAARNDLPMCQQNFHRRFREVYEMPPFFRVSKKEIKKIQGTGYYTLYYSEALYRYYLKCALKIFKLTL